MGKKGAAKAQKEMEKAKQKAKEKVRPLPPPPPPNFLPAAPIERGAGPLTDGSREAGVAGTAAVLRVVVALALALALALA